MSVSWSGPQEVLMIWWFTALLEFTWKRKFNMNQHFYALISYSYLTYTILRPIFSLHLSSRFRMVSSALPTVKLITVFSATERYTTKSPKRANMYTIFCRYHIVVSQIESEDHLLPGLLWPPQECWRIALCSAGPNNCTKVGNSGVNKMWRCSELRSDTSNFKSFKSWLLGWFTRSNAWRPCGIRM